MTDLPAIGATVAYLDLGTIRRTGERRFRATTPTGKCYTTHSRKSVVVAWRSAENFLRGQAGMAKLPKKCTECGADVPGAHNYCRECIPMPTPRTIRQAHPPSESELAFAAMKPGEVLARAQQAASARPMPRGGGAQPTTLQGWGDTEAVHLRAARMAADELLRRRFGVPIPDGYEGYLRDLKEWRHKPEIKATSHI